MTEQCPGRRTTRTLDSLVVRCPACGALVEIFSDEPKARCRCGKTILRDEVPSCLRWCPAAERCLGEVIDLEKLRERLGASGGDARRERYVAEIGRRIERSRQGRGARGRKRSKADEKP